MTGGGRVMVRFAFAFLAVLLLGLTMWQMNYSQEASKLRTDLQAEKVTNLDQAWDRYQKLAASTELAESLRRIAEWKVDAARLPGSDGYVRAILHERARLQRHQDRYSRSRFSSRAHIPRSPLSLR